MTTKQEKRLSDELAWCFKTHRAVRTDFGEQIVAIDWRQAEGSNDHYVRFLFDRGDNNIIISGDLGWCIAHPTWKATPEETLYHIGNTFYFMEKIKASSHLYEYDEDEFAEQIRQHFQEFFNGSEGNEALDDAMYDSYDDFIGEVCEAFDGDGFHEELLSSQAKECLDAADSDWREIVCCAGREPNIRLKLWAAALKLALEQLEEEKKK